MLQTRFSGQYSTNLAFKFILLVFAFIGVLFMAGACVAALIMNNSYKKCTVHTQAEVTNIYVTQERDHDSNHSYNMYEPVVSYKVDGEVIAQPTSYRTNDSEAHYIGEKLEIAYNPDDPEDFYVVGETAFFIVYIIGGIGVLFLIVCAVILVARYRYQKSLN